jgi:hypothetical protein
MSDTEAVAGDDLVVSVKNVTKKFGDTLAN